MICEVFYFFSSVCFSTNELIFTKNDEKTTLKPYIISQQIYLKKNELCARVCGTLRDYSLHS